MVERFVAAVITDLQDLKKTIGGLELDTAFLRSSIDELNVRQGPIIIKTIGNLDFLTWDEENWDEEIWGDTVSSGLTIVRVLNHQNIFLEPFLVDEMIDTNTGTISNEVLTISPGGSTVSKVFALDSIIYTSAKLDATVDNVSLLNLFLSFDGGSTFESVTNGVLHTSILGTNSGLVWKIEYTGTNVVFPFTFPITFAGDLEVEEIFVSFD